VATFVKDSGDPEDGSHLATGTALAVLAQKEPVLDEAVKKPCAESRLGIPGIHHRPRGLWRTQGHALERQRGTSPFVEVFGSLGAPTSNGTALRPIVSSFWTSLG